MQQNLQSLDLIEIARDESYAGGCRNFQGLIRVRKFRENCAELDVTWILYG